MKLIGIDLDNTLAIYDDIFHRLAVSMGLIEPSFPSKKGIVEEIFDKTRQKYKYTEMQAIAYGLEMHSAKPAQGAMRMLKLLRDKGHRIILISHKTKYPIAGGCINLREKATQWLKKEGFGMKRKFNYRRHNLYEY